MRVQDEKIKGFNILELIIVLVIIGVISGLGYPEFSKWRVEREVRSSVVKIKSLMEGINAQVQRGQYAFVQVHIEETAENLIVTSKGMKPDTLGSLLNDGDSTWWPAATEGNPAPPDRCNITDNNYWDDDPSQGSNNIEVRQIEIDNLATTWAGNVGAICFSKNERWFSAGGCMGGVVCGDGTGEEGNPGMGQQEGDQNEVNMLGEAPDNVLFLCKRTTEAVCEIPPSEEDANNPVYTYAINWTRFGSINLEKWRQGQGWVKQ